MPSTESYRSLFKLSGEESRDGKDEKRTRFVGIDAEKEAAAVSVSGGGGFFLQKIALESIKALILLKGKCHSEP